MWWQMNLLKKIKTRMHSHPYNSVVEAQQGLIKKGYTEGFIWSDDKFMTGNKSKSYSISELTIVETYRFEGITNPGDESILFAIEAADGSKGYAISAYGPYADEKFVKFLDEVKKVEDTSVHKNP